MAQAEGGVMPDIYVMNDAISFTIVALALGAGICVAFLWLVGRVRKWMNR